MSNSAKSSFLFGIYLVIFGLTAVVVPTIPLSLFGFAQTTEIWFRFAGMLGFLLGLYYILAGRENVRAFFRWTVYVRPLVIVFLTAFVLLGLAPPALILVGVIDLLGAIWTGLALRSEDRAA